MELVEYWLQDCVYNHPKCNERWDDSDGLPRLPTRVLDVSPENCIRLVVSHGMCGQYAALSHCWGAKPLLRTTSMSIEAHQIGIDFQDLPRTFQDAVRVTRILGLNYIWIDSLCIIQDDRNDWEKEAVMMGSVYEGAYLTIAATGGANGSAGCFIPRPTMPEPVPFPFKLGEQGPAEVIHAALPPAAVVGDLQMNPLAERAWITQEWLLSRRTIHFTKGHLIWVCRTSIQSSAPDFLEEWSDFASTYCRRNLTYPSDKPIALEGVVRIIAFQTKDTYHYGIWDRSAHQQLFWFAQDIISRPAELKEMPSWSWIS
ncbi:HET-domain-containing protein, partial [Glonium stellatum]